MMPGAHRARVYRVRASHAARLGERLALALLDTPDDVAIIGALRQATHARDTWRAAADLADFRAGLRPQVWPARAPWAGF